MKISNRVPFWDKVIPEGIEIDQNYPNPFRDVTSFTFKLGDATHVRLSVHDAMGRVVAVLTNAEYDRGVHSVVLQSAHLPSGLYFYRFMSDEGVIQRKMMLVR
ncbi:MAG: T9SS type A sorting domain-containing protein [Bacteroidota bacterium]|nr:T9SS type A sorting domain-containing protein [Bacteroidota bacterium]